LMTDALLVSEERHTPDEFAALVQEARRRVLQTFEEDTLVEAVARELERSSGFTYIGDEKLVASMSVGMGDAETYLVEQSDEFRMDRRGSIHRGCAVSQRPGAAFVLAGGEEREKPQQSVGEPDHAASGRLGDPEVLEEGAGILGRKLGDLGLELPGEGHDVDLRRAVARAALLLDHGRLREACLIHVDQRQDRLLGEEPVSAKLFLFVVL